MDLLLKTDSEKLSRELREGNHNTDFYQYISSEYSSFAENKKSKLLRTTIQVSLKSYNSPTMDYIVGEILNKEIPRYERNTPLSKEIIGRIVNLWETILRKEGLDQSEIIYFMEKHKVLTFYDLGRHYTNLEIDNKNFAQLKRKDFFLLTYLSSIGKFNKFEIWDRSIWDAMDQFSDREFLVFWEFQGLLSNRLGYYCFDIVPMDKKYILMMDEKKDRLITNRSVIEKIQSRLKQLEDKKYTFEKKIDSEY